MQAGRDWFLARNKMLRQRFAPPLRARRQTAALTISTAELEPGFSRDGPIAIATPTGRLRGESSARYALVWDGGFRSRVRATTTAAGWPRDFSGPFGREARVLCGSWRGLTRSLAVCPCGFVFSGCAGAGVVPMGRLACWRVCGAVVGQTTLVRGAGTLPCVEGPIM